MAFSRGAVPSLSFCVRWGYTYVRTYLAMNLSSVTFLGGGFPHVDDPPVQIEKELENDNIRLPAKGKHYEMTNAAGFQSKEYG